MNSANKTPNRIDASRYTSKQWAAQESEKLWTQTWQIACTVDCVKDSGDYWVYEIDKLSIIITRDQNGSINAFQNFCRHRGAMLLNGSGTGLQDIQCPYHHWRYNLEGHRHKALQNDSMQGKPSSVSLLPVAVDTWAGFVFINPNPTCEPLSEYLESLPDELAWMGMEDFSCSTFMSLKVDCNWKVMVDAFIETYHLHAVHPQMIAIADDINTEIKLYDKHSMFMQPYGVSSPRRAGTVTNQELWEEYVNNLGHRLGLTFAAIQDPGKHPQIPEGETMREVLVSKISEHLATTTDRYKDLDDNHIIDDFHYHIFPNAVFNIFAGWYGLILPRPGPTPDECIVDMWNFDLLAKDDPNYHCRPTIKELNWEETQALGPVFMQDLELLPKVQKGLKQAGADSLRLVPAEARIGRMHQILDRYINPLEGND